MPAQQKLSERNNSHGKAAAREGKKTEMNKGKATSSILRMLTLLTASFKYHCCRPPYVSPQLLLALQTQPESNCPWGELVLERALWRRSPLNVCYATRRSTYIHLSHSLFSRPFANKTGSGRTDLVSPGLVARALKGRALTGLHFHPCCLANFAVILPLF